MRLLAFLMGMLLAMSFSLAYTASVEPVQDEITVGETAVFKLIVTNDMEEEDFLRPLFGPDPSWSIITKPVFHMAGIRLAPGETKETLLYITPDESVDYGRKYTYNFRLESALDEAQGFLGADIFLRSPHGPGEYVPTVEIDADVDSGIDPRKPGTITISLRNFNPLNITELIIDIETTVDRANDQRITTSLSGLKKKTIEASFGYDSVQPPAVDRITIRASVPARNASFEQKVKEVQILAYNNIITNRTEIPGFLKRKVVLDFFNDGNVPDEITHSVRTSLFSQIFTSSEPAHKVATRDGYRYLVWAFDVGVQEAKTITYTINYRPLFVLVLVFLCVLLLYYALRSPIVIRKQAILMKDDRVKVMLHLKNRSSRPVEHVNIMDKIPQIVQVSKEFPVGTMQPTKLIRHEKRGTIAKWTVPSLEAYEERIITYFLESRLKVVGSIRLPGTMVKYKNKIGSLSKAFSSGVRAE